MNDFPTQNMIMLMALLIGLWMPLIIGALHSLWANRENIKGWFNND